MPRILKTFEFLNSDFNIIKESKDDVYIKIWREIRRNPLPGMKQPTPHGGFLGTQVVLEVKYDGLPAKEYNFELSQGNSVIQNGTTDNAGRFYGLEVSESDDMYSMSILTKDLSSQQNIEEI